MVCSSVSAGMVVFVICPSIGTVEPDCASGGGPAVG